MFHHHHSASSSNATLAVSPSPSDALTLSGDTPCATRPSSPSPDDKELGKPAEAEESSPITFDSGSRGYLVVLGGMMLLLATFGLSTSFGVFQAYYRDNQLAAYPPSTISWIGSCQVFFAFGSSMAAGRLFDQGYFRYQLAVGSLLWLVGIFTLSLSTTFAQIFLSQSVCMGLGLGSMFAPCLSCISTYFLKKRTLMIGFAAAGASLGSIIYPILLAKLLPMLGFGPSIRAVGYLMLGLLVMANLLLRPRDLPRRTPEPMVPLLRRFLRQPSMWLTALGVFFVTMAIFILFFYVQTFIKSHGAAPVVGTYALPILNASAVIARVTAGLIADRFGVFNAAVPCAVAVGVLSIAMLGATTTAPAVVFLLLFGLASGAFVSIFAALFFSLSEDISEVGLRGGVGFCFVAIATLVGSPIAGEILVVAGSYVGPCLFAGLSAFVGSGLLVLARRTQVARNGTAKV